MRPERLVPLLLDWFEQNARDLPWRRTCDPYAIWVSEIMLQQTQVKTVLPYWERWMKALPSIASLARTKPERLYKLWEGLGYYTRVRNLQKAAQMMMEKHDGRFPQRFEEVLELPGVGRYTAGAVCSIAFNQPRPILDGNVMRVLVRLFAIEGNPREKVTNAQLWSLAERLVQEAHKTSAGDKFEDRKSQMANRKFRCSHLNQSLMELGALVCTPRDPHCELCPLITLCLARKQGRIEELPRVSPRPAASKRRFVAFVVKRRGKFLVRQRPEGAVNAHLWEFPNIEVANDDGNPGIAGRRALGFTPSGIKLLGSIHHSITRYRIRMDVFQAAAHGTGHAHTQRGRWLGKQDLHRLPFASAHKKILAGL
ncbi:MAG TPA: A/G-specific adenine glycosylase [Verrucomicrobiae bacterium]|nr:A/G-specific adenine glycosylase [Verrucomicrobiae bacterium]